MAKAEIKTKETDSSVDEFLNSLPEEQREDSFKIVGMMKRSTGDVPKMWGSAIIGFGNRVYRSPATGREVDWMKVGFSPRKANLSLYILNGAARQAGLLEKLGKHKTGKGCLYIKRLSDIDEKVLERIIKSACRKK
jgi:hypothetical protein